MAIDSPPDAAENPPAPDDPHGGRVRVWLRRSAIALGAVFVAIQFVPYGWHHTNPPVVQDAPWPTAESEAIARESCYACHSNETDWPLYSYVAPASWLVRRDVDTGRDELNFSRWNRDSDEADDAIDAVVEGFMPPSQYTVIHRGATLTDHEVEVLVAALRSMDDHGGSDDGDGDDGGDDDNSGSD